MKTILFVTNTQFGYHTDTFKYSEYLAPFYKIEFITIDEGLPKITNNNINIHYMENKNKYFKRVEFIKIIRKVAKKTMPDIIFIDYFIGIGLVKLLLGNKFNYNMDIRTGVISKNAIVRKTKNLILRLDCYAFQNISIISEGLQKHLHINNKKTHIVPLGAEKNVSEKKVNLKNKAKKNINLVYVGTLYERNIEQTVMGIRNYLDKYSDEDINITYDIIGFSKITEDEEKIEKYIDELQLSNIVKFHGRLEHKIALEFIQKADIGISYIPITEYFNFQPPTKTFEYLLSGIPCIATNTYENAQIINDVNGILINDTPESFSKGLYEVISNNQCYDSGEIINSVKNYTWENIIVTNLRPYLSSLCEK